MKKKIWDKNSDACEAFNFQKRALMEFLKHTTLWGISAAINYNLSNIVIINNDSN